MGKFGAGFFAPSPFPFELWQKLAPNQTPVKTFWMIECLSRVTKIEFNIEEPRGVKQFPKIIALMRLGCLPISQPPLLQTRWTKDRVNCEAKKIDSFQVCPSV